MEQGSRIWNKDVADKYGIPRNTVSTWFKNKEKLFSSLEKVGTIRRERSCMLVNLKMWIKLFICGL